MRNLRRLQRLERKLGKHSADDKQGLVIADEKQADVHLWDFLKQDFILIRRDDESAQAFNRRVAKVVEEIPASIMSRAEAEETAMRLIRECPPLMSEDEARREAERLLRGAEGLG